MPVSRKIGKGKKKGLKNSSKRNNLKPQYAASSNEEINDSEDIEP